MAYSVGIGAEWAPLSPIFVSRDDLSHYTYTEAVTGIDADDNPRDYVMGDEYPYGDTGQTNVVARSSWGGFYMTLTEYRDLYNQLITALRARLNTFADDFDSNRMWAVRTTPYITGTTGAIPSTVNNRYSVQLPEVQLLREANDTSQNSNLEYGEAIHDLTLMFAPDVFYTHPYLEPFRFHIQGPTRARFYWRLSGYLDFDFRFSGVPLEATGPLADFDDPGAAIEFQEDVLGFNTPGTLDGPVILPPAPPGIFRTLFYIPGGGGAERAWPDWYSLLAVAAAVIEAGPTNRNLVLTRGLATFRSRNTVLALVESFSPIRDDAITLWAERVSDSSRDEVIAAYDSGKNITVETTVDRATYELRRDTRVLSTMSLRDESGRVWNIIGIEDADARRNMLIHCERQSARRIATSPYRSFPVPIRSADDSE